MNYSYAITSPDNSSLIIFFNCHWRSWSSCAGKKGYDCLPIHSKKNFSWGVLRGVGCDVQTSGEKDFFACDNIGGSIHDDHRRNVMTVVSSPPSIPVQLSYAAPVACLREQIISFFLSCTMTIADSILADVTNTTQGGEERYMMMMTFSCYYIQNTTVMTLRSFWNITKKAVIMQHMRFCWIYKIQRSEKVEGRKVVSIKKNECIIICTCFFIMLRSVTLTHRQADRGNA